MSTPDAPWPVTSRVVGPIAAGPGTLSGAASTAKVDPDASAPPPAWATQRPSRWGQVADSVAASRAQQPDSGWSNGDGGAESGITADDLQAHTDALSSKLDELSSSVSRMANSAQGGQQGNQNLQQLAKPMALPPRESPFAASAAQRARAGEQQAQSASLLQGQRARSSAIWQQRQAQGGMRPTQPTANGMGSTTAEASMNGLLGRQVGGGTSANGQSESTFANTRFQS